ncbi:MAG: iron transporter [Hyphomicrobiaceae bacterium]|nr:iron transporter [Hyphomicrobiaceae bacterium]
MSTIFKKAALAATVAFGALLSVSQIQAAETAFSETPIGGPVMKNGMQIVAVYLENVGMDPVPANGASGDIHVEADIHAIAGNKHGFSKGQWIPGLSIKYDIEKVGGGLKASGSFIPMLAIDGAHYGINMKLAGKGKYKITYHISPPGKSLFRHATGKSAVPEWWKPFAVSWEFDY